MTNQARRWWSDIETVAYTHWDYDQMMSNPVDWQRIIVYGLALRKKHGWDGE